jgi:hypothetical protein
MLGAGLLEGALIRGAGAVFQLLEGAEAGVAGRILRGCAFGTGGGLLVPPGAGRCDGLCCGVG